MKKRGKIFLTILILIISSTFVYAAVSHSARDIRILIDSIDDSLQENINQEGLKGSHVYSSNPNVLFGQHDANEIWISIQDGEMTLLDALSSTHKLCPNPSFPTRYSSADIPSVYHTGMEINLDSGKTLQVAINDGDYCCIPECDGKNCGDDGCGGNCGTCSLTQHCDTTTQICISDCDSQMGEVCGGYGTCMSEGTVQCDGTCSGSFLAKGTSCSQQNSTCYAESTGLFKVGIQDLSDCVTGLGTCDGMGKCIGWQGTGCSSCPAGYISGTKPSLFKPGTGEGYCKLNSTLQGRYQELGVWSIWSYSIKPVCEIKSSCGFFGSKTCTTKYSWQIKP